MLADELRRAQAPAPATTPQPPAAALVLERAKQLRTAEAYDLVAALFPGTAESREAQDAAAKLREVFALDSAGPSYEGGASWCSRSRVSSRALPAPA